MELCKPNTEKRVRPTTDRLINTAHSLIAGTTGSGKSVMMNTLLYFLMGGSFVDGCDKDHAPGVILIDLKRVELTRWRACYNVQGVITEPHEVVPGLLKIKAYMEDRYRKMQAQGLLETTERPLYILVDELAYTVEIPGVVDLLADIGRLGRAAHIHLICATQDPSRKTLPAKLMQNFTCCLALRCRSAIESRQIIGIAGAEELPRYGEGIIWDADGTDYCPIPKVPEEDIEVAIKVSTPQKRGFFARFFSK